MTRVLNSEPIFSTSLWTQAFILGSTKLWPILLIILFMAKLFSKFQSFLFVVVFSPKLLKVAAEIKFPYLNHISIEQFNFREKVSAQRNKLVSLKLYFQAVFILTWTLKKMGQN